MKSHARRLNNIRRLSCRCALAAAFALLVLFADWLYLIGTDSGGGYLLPKVDVDANALCIFDYIERAGMPHVEFGSNDSIVQTGFRATNLNGTVVFSQSSYLLTERYLTPKWAKTQTSKYIWAEITTSGMHPVQTEQLPTQFIPLARQLVDQQEPETATILSNAIDDTLSNKRYLPGIIHNLLAITLVAVALLGCTSFVYLLTRVGADLRPAV